MEANVAPQIKGLMILALLSLSMIVIPHAYAQDSLFDVNNDLRSYATSFENPTGARGSGGTVASPLGVGRKGAPAALIEAGQTVQLCDIEGTGTIRHIWMTTLIPAPIFRNLVVRAYWDGQEHPSIEAPLGDLMGFAHGKVVAYQSAAHSVGEKAGMNLWTPMPFTKRARITITNEGPFGVPLFYQIDYTLGDKHKEDVGRLHVLFRRENTTTEGKDFELLPKRSGKGRLLGCVIGIRTERTEWWGEGEMKAFIDGDTEFPTICGTGAEDYVGLSFGVQETPFLYNGCSLDQKGFINMYRWHHRDPIYWKEDIRITIQQIGHLGGPSNTAEQYMNNLYEIEDDWSTATFWYEAVPSQPLPPFPDAKARTADLWK